MSNEQRNFLALPYGELEELNLKAKSQRRDRVAPDTIREDRLKYLRRHGPTPYAFTLKVHFPPPDSAADGPLLSPADWACTV